MVEQLQLQLSNMGIWIGTVSMSGENLVPKDFEKLVNGTSWKLVFRILFFNANIFCSVQAGCFPRPEERVPRGRTQSHRHTM
jgi:hypothetical protein